MFKSKKNKEQAQAAQAVTAKMNRKYDDSGNRILTEDEVSTIAIKILPNWLFINAINQNDVVSSLRKHDISSPEEVITIMVDENWIAQYSGYSNVFTTTAATWKLLLQFQSTEQRKEAKTVLKDIYKVFLIHGTTQCITPEGLAAELIAHNYSVNDYDEVKKLVIALAVNNLVSRKIIRSEKGYIVEISENGLRYLNSVLSKSERQNLPDRFKNNSEDLKQLENKVVAPIKKTLNLIN